MKITREDAVKNTMTQKPSRDNSKSSGAFDAILHGAMEDKKAVQGTQTQKMSALNGSPIIDTATFLSVDNKPHIVEGAERMLDILDEFQTKLADTRVSLDDLSPVIKRMNQEKDLLLPFVDSLPDTDPLKDILNRALITCSVEVGKFERGDYL